MKSDLPFHTFKRYLVNRYGKPLQRIPIDPGYRCPHRTPDGGGGCTFCDLDGSRAPQTAGLGRLEDQIAGGIAFARHRYGPSGLIAYVQPFTTTNADPADLARLYERILELAPFDALCVATRPDCLSPPIIDVLCRFRQRLDVWVELGIQTTHDRTLLRVNRQHTWADSSDALQRLASRRLLAVAHVILGLPGENAADFRLTASRLARFPLAGIKLHNLHVIRGTALADEYTRAPFPVFDEDAYATVLIDFLRRTPSSTAILRLNTDSPADRLVAPRWTMSKPQFRSFLIRRMRHAGVCQGDLLSEASA